MILKTRHSEDSFGRQLLCGYCGIRSATDREHVFPKGLYPASKAKSKVQRLTIDSCNQCNNGWADDEAHFRNILTLAGEPNPARLELWRTAVTRSFTQPDGHRRIKDIRNLLKPVQIDRARRYMIYPAQDQRVLRIVKKIVRGLSHHHRIMSAVPEELVWADILKYQVPPDFLAAMTYEHRIPTSSNTSIS